MKWVGFRCLIFLGVLELSNTCQQRKENHNASTKAAYQIESKNNATNNSLADSIIDRCLVFGSVKESDLHKLDSIACIADDEQSEAVAMAGSSLWERQFHALIRYLASHPESCSRQQIVWGLSEDLATGSARVAIVDSFRATAAGRATVLTVEEKRFLKELVADVRPEIFD